jgi:hypothetical protein
MYSDNLFLVFNNDVLYPPRKVLLGSGYPGCDGSAYSVKMDDGRLDGMVGLILGVNSDKLVETILDFGASLPIKVKSDASTPTPVTVDDFPVLGSGLNSHSDHAGKEGVVEKVAIEPSEKEGVVEQEVDMTWGSDDEEALNDTERGSDDESEEDESMHGEDLSFLGPAPTVPNPCTSTASIESLMLDYARTCLTHGADSPQAMKVKIALLMMKVDNATVGWS